MGYLKIKEFVFYIFLRIMKQIPLNMYTNKQFHGITNPIFFGYITL